MLENRGTMKQGRIHTVWLVFYMAMLLLASCSQDVIDSPDGNNPSEDGFYIALQLDNENLSIPGRATSESVSLLNENVIAVADLFIVDGTGNIILYHHEDAVSQLPIKIYEEDWKTKMDEGTHTIYALANYKGEANLTEIRTLEELLKVKATDADIFKWEGMNMDGQKYEGKTFLMDGNCPFKRDEGISVYKVTVPMKRAAAKVEISVQLSADFSDKFKQTEFKTFISQYATHTAAWEDAEMLEAADRGFASLDQFTNELVYEKGTDTSVRKLRFYTYVNRWEDLVTNETMVLIDVPGTYIADGSESEKVLAHNYYKVPIIIGKDTERILQRNHFYQMTVTVNMLGAEEISEPVELNASRFTVAPWGTETINVGQDDMHFLTLSENIIDIRNVDGYDELEFYSSSPITKVEFIGGNTALLNGVNFDYPGGGSDIPSIYFVNKNNERKEVNAQNISLDWDKNKTTGFIRLKSPNPTNVTKRYITLKVTNEDGLEKYVVIVQSPLEYIQPIEGYYSYRDDFLSPSSANPSGVPCTWESNFTYSGKNPSFPTENNFFKSKVVEDNTVYIYSFERKNGSATPQRQEAYSLQNNMMYFVTITSTDEEYQIARPMLEKINIGTSQRPVEEKVTDDASENQDLVSPLFMLASQLGGVRHGSIGGWENARKHCAYYVETYQKNGQTIHLQDWRVPTHAELKIIQKYQTTTPDVMDKVLSGDYYYGADGNPFYANGGTSNPRNPGIRCIRDVNPGEFDN